MGGEPAVQAKITSHGGAGSSPCAFFSNIHARILGHVLHTFGNKVDEKK